MRKTVCLFSGLLLLLSLQTAGAAKRLGPPIEDLQSAPDRVRIVVAEARDKTAPNGILFAINERLSGEAPEEVLLRTDEQTFADVQAGRSYIVAWTYLRGNRRVIGGWEVDPDGPSTVEVIGLGAVAVFEDTAELRFLFSPGAMEESATAGKQLDALLAQMQREDARSRGLVIAELYLRPDLTVIMGPPQVELLGQVLQDAALAPQYRDLLLQSALNLPPDLASPWLAEEFRRVIILHGTQYDLASFVPALIETAASGLQQAGAAADIDLLGMLLYANNPGVAKAALAAIDHFDPAAAAARAQQALERGWIHSETRLALQRYLAQSGSASRP
jgi:hypothetical protein